MSLNTKQDAIDFLNMVKSDADSDGITFYNELEKYSYTDGANETGRIYNDSDQVKNFNDLMIKFHPDTHSEDYQPDSDVVKHAEQWLDSDQRSGFIK